MSESWPGSRDQVEATIDLNVPIKMRDGLVTRADVYRPRKEGRHPVLLQRTPYDKGIGGFANLTMRPIRAVSRGYAVVIQDVRGRWNSEGRFDPFRQEIDDGYDSVEWCGTQPWSNGKVGMYGGSYVGATQWLAAASGAPHLKCIYPALTAANYYEEWFYRGGALQLSFVESWCVNSFCATELFRRGRKDEAEKMLDVRDAMAEKVFDHIPVARVPYFRGNAEFFYDWVSHPEQDAYWQEINLENFHSKIGTPAFNLGGWYDIFLEGTISNFLRMRKNGRTKASRKQKLLIGPWMHLGRASDLGKLVGDVDFGHEAAYAGTDVEGMVLDWYDSWLMDGPEVDTPPVRIFVMGENVWRDENEWPLARTEYTDYYIHSAGSANTLDGDGSLDRSAPADESPDRFLYDPLDPVPTVGGAMCCDATFNPAGPYDQASVERRKDVLVYSTPPLNRPVEVTGRVVMKLFAATSAADTDFTAKLVDVWTCGYAQLLTQGIIRARYREGTKRAKLIRPGGVYEYTVDLWSTSNLFRKGHRIRVEVSSSNFPHFERNMNTARQPAKESNPVVAEQHVYHDADRPSRLILPVIPR
jgi:putative CocE/NonD family hydrolase